jgi:Tfp pilus assembly protein PilO
MSGLVKILFKYFHILILAYYGYMYGTDGWEKYKKGVQDSSRFVVIENQIKRNKQKLKKIQKFKKDIIVKEQELAQIVKQIEEVQRQLPDVINDTGILSIFDKEAQKVNNQQLEMEPLSEKKKDFYFAKRYKFKGKATFLQFLIYFERLGKNDRLINVTNLNLESTKIKQKGRFQLIQIETEMEIYRYNTAYKEKRKIK